LASLDQQITAHLNRKDALAEGRARFDALSRDRQKVQADLTQLDARWAQDDLFPLEKIQAQLSAETALLAWVDFAGAPTAADPNGEHWACVVRYTGTPVWQKLPGSAADQAWTKDDDALPKRFRRLLAQPDSDLDKLARQLYAQRLAPVERHLSGV